MRAKQEKTVIIGGALLVVAASFALLEAGCGGESRECSRNSDCMDGDICTEDRCLNGRCSYKTLTWCCISDSDCNGSTPRCLISENMCVECLGDQDCDDSEYCDPDHECLTCEPQCESKCCGDDGCGGTCPDNCQEGKVCNQDTCECCEGGYNGCPVIRSLDVSPPQIPFDSCGDLWFSTWADDDSLFVSWGDGEGPISEPPDPTTHHGLARITGRFPNAEAEVVQRYMPLSDDLNNSKPTSLLFLDGRLYVAIHYPLIRPEQGFIAYSDDYGATFHYETNTHRTKSENRNFVCLMFINMGRSYELNEDGYVYAFGTDAEVHMESPVPDSRAKDMWVYLARMPRQDILDYSAWTYFSGMNASNEPRWTSEWTEASIIQGLSDTIDRPWPDYPMLFSSIFHPGIQRYIALTATVGQGELFESPNPWGPWVSAGRWFEKGDGTQWHPAYMPGIVPKDTGPNSFYFVGAGQHTIWTGSTQGFENYKFRIGQISMTL